jgi:hypothetical protein
MTWRSTQLATTVPVKFVSNFCDSYFRFIEHLRDFCDVFTIALGSKGSNTPEHVSLHSSLRTPEDRTLAIGNVIKSLGDMIPGIRNEVLRIATYIFFRKIATSVVQLFYEMCNLLFPFLSLILSC